MLIALTGLHAAGKTYFSSNIPPKYGFFVYSKKDIIKLLCKESTGRDDWQQWYREEFNRNAYQVTSKILSYLNLQDKIILDAIHSDLEWKIIKSIVKDAELVQITTPEFIRKQRREEGDEEKDKKRMGYWHNGGGCLISEVSWTFNGGASLELNEKMFQEFLQYTKNKEKAMEGENIQFTDNKTEKLQELIAENEILKNKLVVAEELLAEYETKKKRLNREEEVEK